MMPSPKQRARGNIKFPLIKLPNELLLEILGYLNQVDAILLSLTCKRFKEVTRTKLFRVLNVYNKGKAFIPKCYYVKQYTNFTHIGLERFLKKLKEGSFIPDCKQVYFQNDELLDVSQLDLISSKLKLCMFSMYRNSKSDVQRWILLQKDPSRVPVHHISSSTREYKEPRVSSPILNRHERIHVRDLTISNSDNINLAYELSRYPNLKYLCIHNLRVDDHLPQISATKIRIARSEKFNKVRFFQCFDVTRITSLNLENALLGIVPLAPEFVSLRELTIKEDTEVMVIFASCLIANSLTSISIPSNPEIDTRPALNHHCGSLRFIKCDFDPSYIIRKNPYEAKKIFYRLILDFERFPKLEWAIHLGVALRVNKKRDAFAKVWFHPEEYPY